MHSATPFHAFQTPTLCAMVLVTWFGLAIPACAQSHKEAPLKSVSTSSHVWRQPEIVSDMPAEAEQHRDERALDFSPALTKSRLPAPPSINGSLGGDMKFTLRLRGHGLSLGVHSDF